MLPAAGIIITPQLGLETAGSLIIAGLLLLMGVISSIVFDTLFVGAELVSLGLGSYLTSSLMWVLPMGVKEVSQGSTVWSAALVSVEMLPAAGIISTHSWGYGSRVSRYCWTDAAHGNSVLLASWLNVTQVASQF